MKAALYKEFGQAITIEELPDPTPHKDGVVIRVQANGICRSDWHGWMGHDGDVRLPHVPGHELAGIVEAVGKNVTKWQIGDRVTLPFACGCGSCRECLSGNHQVCDNYFQPGFTAWGSFAEYVGIRYADTNLVKLPESLDFEDAASLGCRFITSFRAIVAQGRVAPGEWVVVHGCGGIGLSAIMIANAIGAQVIGVDIKDEALNLAKLLGAAVTLNPRKGPNLIEAIREITKGGAQVSIDALGSNETCLNSLLSLRKRGRHVQIGVMADDDAETPIPMGMVMFNELELIGSHGMQAHAFGPMLDMITTGKLHPGKMITRRVSLEEGIKVLESMGEFSEPGVVVITQF
ncbi:MAG: zinc-dependent alcohol dehydrogenase family protein [Anaerolineales bacterium]|uniref:Zinc-dependent alcohol dehydrogenase family protein n=1 Tax=Candidatus Desulfolinea nitratireducens TaxID=2841698 RepID=A0A8J6NPA5_9CHLR|nr:zinc-dependent alcohol dehydrogenase family protein [Candidatus Desulfolinea nitratireducens]MBL6961561.1 zinc-dependent alcohol dehydrogenase family protein [Anaerolineales bacterium]